MEFVSEKSGERLDKFLADHYTGISRSRFQKLIKEGVIKVDGKPAVKPGLELKKGDRVVILEEKIIAPGEEFPIEPEPEIPLNIVYEDKDILVINKQAGLLVHPTLSQKKHTLVNALIARYPEIKNVGESPLRPGIVHRLDKDTSGLMLVAKNQAAFEFLKEQFLNRKVTKKYLALVEGIPKDKEGIIEYDIRPSKQNRLRKVAIKKEELQKKSRRTAKTAYKLRQIIKNKFALLEVAPLTGRTHQIRVHLAAIGHPVVGDRLYGAKTRICADISADQRGLDPRKSACRRGQFLHAYYLKFTTPNGAPLALQADIPEDLEKIIQDLKTKTP